MTTAQLLPQRLANQQISAPRGRKPHEVVAWLGAMQAQEYAMAKWSIGLRLPGATDALVENAFNTGAIVRTHVLRPTWHFVVPADLRWMLALTAPRVRAFLAYMDRKIGIDRALVRRSNAVFARVLAGGQHLTRTELQAALRRAKITADGHRLAHLCMHAELDALICSGPRRGKQFTYALVDERVPPGKALTHDDALAELARRYFVSRGPATARDFAWWSGLTVKDATAGIATLGPDFVQEKIDEQLYVFASNATLAAPPRKGSADFLMPDYDEYGIAYADRSALFSPSGRELLQGRNGNFIFNRMIVLDGVIVGSWRRTEAVDAVDLEAVPFAPLAPAKRRALQRAAERYAAFVGKPGRLLLR